MPKEAYFYIEKEIYAEWAKSLDTYIKPDVMITGHEHCVRVQRTGSPEDEILQPCPVIVGAQLVHQERYYIGAGITFGKESIDVVFMDNHGVTVGWETL